jgi:hypothetical protein
VSLELEIDVRKKGLPHFTLRIPGATSIDSDHLDRAMDICNRHMGDPSRNLGGPQTEKPKA